jgi:hypothetical protein
MGRPAPPVREAEAPVDSVLAALLALGRIDAEQADASSRISIVSPSITAARPTISSTA